jgi:carbon-monoxide dehydrogenase large subunit
VSILGNRVRRVEDPKFLTIGGTYIDDLEVPGALWATFVRSNVAHGRIERLDLSEVRQMPGVVAAFGGEDLDVNPAGPPLPVLPAAMTRPLLALGTVRFVGEPVAVILAEERYIGEDALEAVEVDYETLPALVDPELALGGEVVLFPEAGTNVALDMRKPLDQSFFEDCEVVVSETFVNQRLAPCPLEVRSGVASFGPDGRLTYWACSQHPHGVKGAICSLYGLPADQVRVITPDVGGGFGAKGGPYPEELLLPWLAKQVGRPVRWTETRSESMLALGHGRAQRQRVTIGGDRSGKVKAYRLEVVQDAGAYPALGAYLPFLTALMSPGTYDIAKVETSAVSVVTNTTPLTAYRGAGRPEATAAIERAMDLFAAEVGLDPAEVRRRNLLRDVPWPHTTPAGATYDVGDYPKALERVLEAAGYEELRAEQARRRQAKDVRCLGIGVSTYVEVTNGLPDPSEYARVEITPEGRARVFTGSSPHGQGHATTWAMIASAQLGISMDLIEVVANDTDLVPKGGGTFGSRSAQAGGSAVHEAAGMVVDEARRVAAELLEASAHDVVLDRQQGRFHVAGTPAVYKTWAEVAASAGGLAVEHSFKPTGATFPFGAHVAVVEVDSETGQVRLLRLVALDDAGTVINPLLAEGQRHGGLAQGAAQALLEEFVYDHDGNPLTANLADYAMISAPELPSFELVDMSTPTSLNPLGAKGIGESGTIGSTPAIQSAVVDALSHLGVRHLDMPATPQKVWQAIRSAQQAQ